MSGPLQSMADPMSTYNTSMRYIQEQEDIRGRERRKKLSREWDRDSSSDSIPDKPSSGYMELSRQLNQKHYKSKPKSAMVPSSSIASNLEASTSSNYSNSSLKERVTDNTGTNTNKYCCIQ